VNESIRKNNDGSKLAGKYEKKARERIEKKMIRSGDKEDRTRRRRISRPAAASEC